ncbi:Glycine cleavage system transcriptional activator [Paraburkholderia sediminicola]|uniref:Glycine cleavage system transcriptional activator n=1 Tax=Paraburkholderia sediminicola TaxID=458836 RepID=A0A6J5BSF0_9BURK|nr:LysR substrate-binding domain-containing protein [Paraburkholderia sediminicola]CAB3716722.1 Glycine cleavage system transcriptional activator [Paraburkholderia sediminicola]
MDKLYRPPSIGALQALLLVAESDNFTEAAEKLHLTQSAVSRKIQQLESHYGVPLFVRNSRSVQLTRQGKEVLEVTRKILDELQTLDERISPRDRPFRIRIFVSLAVRWLLPRLTDFYARHPDLSLSIETVATEVVDPSGHCDAYILYLPEAREEPTPESPTFLRLFDEILVPVCAPFSVDNKPLPGSLEALAQHTLIHGSTGQHEWSIWLKANGGSAAKNYKHITFNLDELAMNAAARGLGVAMTDLTLAQESINRGDLVIPFGTPLKTKGVYVLWLQTAGALHPGRQRILQWFAEQEGGALGKA